MTLFYSNKKLLIILSNCIALAALAGCGDNSNAALAISNEDSTVDAELGLQAPAGISEGGDPDLGLAPAAEQSENAVSDDQTVKNQSEQIVQEDPSAPPQANQENSPALVEPPEPTIPVSLTPPEQELNTSSIQFPTAVEQLRGPEGNTSEQALVYGEQRYQDGFNTTLRRITSNNVFASSNGEATHFYSKRQAWNKDHSLLDVGDKLINPVSLDIFMDSLPISSERNWSNTDKGLMYGIRYNDLVNALATFDVYHNHLEIIYTFTGYRDCTLGSSEGNLSNDDRYAVIVCTEIDRNQTILISFDIEQRKILATKDAQANYNWASVSQLGEYIVVENNDFPDNNAQLVFYDKYFNNRRDVGNPTHGDLGIDENGDEVFVMIDEYHIRYVRLKDGVEFLLSVSNSTNYFGYGHLSCRNLLRPGWCYFSSTSTYWLGAVKISQQENKVEHWGYHRSNSNDYAAEPQAVPNRTGSQVLFTSDWFGREEINDYVLSAPE